ncbi:hypothetical protein SAY86_025545 [Trapa natans]|uniref:Uncharacterized protein n=1 Tax=Trapa natans TaxID=22666 RepID=A0AAN7RF43_TRANT|nr:hypothetical protein SAY86_025545 [Trapa natans]
MSSPSSVKSSIVTQLYPWTLTSSSSLSATPRLAAGFNRPTFMKKNVDALKLIQVGLTFTDAHGNLPDFGTDSVFIWEFYFRDFVAWRDPHRPESVALLRRQGIDFERNRNEGVNSVRFPYLLRTSGLLFNPYVRWITFHSAYDCGHLIKILVGCALPARMEDFLGLLRIFFGPRVFHVKHMMLLFFRLRRKKITKLLLEQH